MFNGNGASDCREDEASIQLVQLVVTEFALKILTQLATSLFLLARRCCISANKEWKTNFQESQEIVWILYYQLLIWASTVFFPWMVVLQPILIFILFWSYYTYLQIFCRRPVSQTNRETTGPLISVLSFASLFVWIVGYSSLFLFNMQHKQRLSDPGKLCGPYKDLTNFQDGMV